MPGFTPIRRRCCRKQLLHIDRIEAIRPVAEVAPDLDLPALGQHRANLVRPQASQHPDHALTRAAAAEEHRRRLEQPYVVLVEEPPQDLAIAQCLQFFGAQCIGEQLHAPPCILDLLGGRQLHLSMEAGARLYAVVRQPLQQQSRGALFRRVQPQARRQLLGGLEIFAQAIGEALAAQRHHALIALRQIVILQRHREIPFAGQRRQIAPFMSFAITRDRTHAELARALREHEMHRPLPLQLQAQRPVELQRRGEQHRRGHGFAERFANRRRIVAMFQQRAPRRVQVHDVPPDRVMLEQKAMQTIAVVHGLQVGLQPDSFFFNNSFTCAGFALPPVTFITCPTKKPNSLSLPERYCASCCGFAAITSSMVFSIAELSVICRSPFAAMIASASLPSSHICSKTSLAILPEIVASAMRASSPARRRASMRDCVTSTPSLLSAPDSSPITQYAASFSWPGTPDTTAS